MTGRAGLQCVSCQRFQSQLTDFGPEQKCTAFAGKIPDPIWNMEFDHRKPYPGDHNQQWIARAGGFQFPDKAIQKGK